MANKLSELLKTIRTINLDVMLHTLVYPLRKAWAEAAWHGSGRRRHGLHRWRAFRRALGPRRSLRGHTWEALGGVEALTPTDHGVIAHLHHGRIEVLCLAPDLVRVRYLPADPPPEPVPYAIAKPPEAWPVPAFVPLQTPHAYLILTEALVVGIELHQGTVFFATPQGRLLRADVEAGFAIDGAVLHRAALAPEERLFGLGERTTPADRRGRTHILWNTDPAGYQDGDDPINLNIPTYLGTHSGGSYLVFYENPYYAEFDLGESTVNAAEHRFAGGELRYYFAAGDAPRLLERYTELTGRHALPPLWLLGYHQSRWSYYPEARVRQLAADFRAHRVPCDAIHLDIDYMRGYRVFTWDHRRFPDPPRLAADLLAQGIKLITIIDPGVKKDPGYSVYRRGLSGKRFCTTPDGQVFHAPVWPGLSALPDFTAPGTRLWWGEQYAPLIRAGIAGFWNDMNEPAAFMQRGDRTLPDTVRHALEGRGGDHREAHNLYGMQMARASAEGIRRLRPDRRPVVITRAGWAGVQRHATSWTGDNYSTWESLRLTIPMMLGLGLSGLGFTGPDIGGFVGAADGELFTRWVQMAAFMPFFRAHTIKGTPDQEPWSYGEPYLSIVRRFIELRYELLPYLYTAVWQMTQRGWPVVRPLAWTEAADSPLWGVQDAFLCGDALLVAPVGFPGAAERPVRLPSGAWFDFWTNQPHAGGQATNAYAPLELMPLFVRAGSVLPMGEYGPSVEQRNDRFLRLGVYPPTGEGRAVSELYEDAGEGFAFEAGACRLSRLIQTREADRLHIEWARQGDYRPPYEHIELSLHGLARSPRAVKADGIAYPVLATDPVRHSALLAVPPFDTLEIAL